MKHISEDIAVSGFYVDFYGDKSVGIFDENYIIKADGGEFHFQGKDDLKLFKEKILDAFEIVTGERCGIKTFEEQHTGLDA